MAVAARKFEGKNKKAQYVHGWVQRLAGAGSLVLIAGAAVHFCHRLGIEAFARWDFIGWILGYAG